MLSTSPDPSTAASPPGPPSSQSSSVGSCYTSESSRASYQARPTLSDPSSSSTSPASAYDRASEQPNASCLFKRPAQPTANYTSPSSSAVHPYEAVANATSQPFSQRHRAMQPPASGMRDNSSASAFHRAGPSTADASAHATREMQPFSSPDNHRGPVSKARRTSPGGSRASGNLDPSHDSTHYSHSFSNTNSGATSATHLSPSAHASGSSTAATAWANPVASGRPPDADAGALPRWPPSQNDQSLQASQPSTSAMLSPRTQVDDGHVDAAAVPSADARSLTQASPQASSSSATDRSASSAARSKPASLPKMDLATFAPQELLKILATLLHEIATANDEFQPDGSKDESFSRRRAARSRDRSAPATAAEGESAASLRDYTAPPGSHLSFNDSRRPSVTTAALGALATPSSTLCFHARNVPSISIESYLLRILKYCPTTNEVFLSLLVYFDRMSRMGTGAKPGANGDGQVAGEAAGLPRASERATGQPNLGSDLSTRASDGEAQPYTHPGIRGFAIDSYNVHRLVIAGVTVASKFFSDVFYTNSRYAKVGGLPPHELNQLELQFLLLNDFRLTIPLDEMQRYADQLLMYASGRPDMAKLTKPVSLAVAASTSGTASESATPVAAAKSEHATPTATIESSTEARPASHDGGGGAGQAGADAEGDVQMSER
ncbi:related to PCL6-cyclin like protein interacting with Pho85p [Sporisorium reilianum SRZ2]|uniref:Related to PCL6-cyclin like protein interacting with Pho85p n=1 Tax=Sporisorium reilianum (strain SRZ2) TaxID=999809 RepID=E7A0U9_SPORE|nr:related to PCL6-cyclin like protein interacting with Pho85p [Sporisorium reilianum SRZ2]